MDRFEKYQRLFSEMAFKREKIELEIQSSNRNRNKHLILCFIFKNSKNIKHWQNEICADIQDIANMKWKANNGYLSKEEYFNNLWNMPFENKDNYEYIDRLYNGFIISKYKNVPKLEFFKDDLIFALKDFYKSVSLELSKNNITNKLIYDLIKKFINN